MNRLEYITQVWCVSARLASAGKNQLASIIKGESIGLGDLKEMRKDLESRTEMLYAFPVKANQSAFEVVSARQIERSNIPVGSTAIVQVNGVIQKSGDACSKGIDSYIRELEMAGVHPNIEGVLIEVHSGGGSAFGPEDFANTVADFEKRYNKPIAALIKNEAASAAYMMIARAPRIFISGQSALAGSIGTMITLFDDAGALEEMGLKEIVIRASDSFNKNDEFYQAMTGNSEPMQRNILDPLNKSFQDIVKKGRRGKLSKKKDNGVPEVLTGKVYIGNDIIDIGLADEVGSRYDAMRWLSKRSKEMKSNTNKSKSIKQMLDFQKLSQEELTKKLEANAEKINSSDNKDSEEFKALQQEQSVLEREIKFREYEQNAKQVDSLNSKVSDLEEQIAQSGDELKTLQSEKAELEKQLAEKESSNKELNQKLEEAEKSNEKVAELESQVEAMNEKQVSIEAENKAYKSFVENNFGSNEVKAIAASIESGSEQPEVKKGPARILSRKEQKVVNSYSAKKAAREMFTKNQGE